MIGIPRWRWFVLLQLILLLMSAGLFASYGMVAPALVTGTAFVLGLAGTAYLVGQENHSGR